MIYKKIAKISLIFGLFMILFGLMPQRIHAIDLLEGMESSNAEYPMEHYMIDFHAPDENNWLPWNWGRAITGGAIWLLYALTAVFWYLQVLLSELGGWLVEEAFTTSVIGDLSMDLGRIVSELWEKFSDEYLLWVVIVVGVYIAYTALIKKEGSKAMQAFVNFALTLVIAIVVFGRADHYIKLANDLSAGISESALDAGTSILNLQTETENGIGVIRGMLHDLQIKQPWLMMQYGHTSVPKETYEQLLKHPLGTEERSLAVQSEVEEKENMMLSPSGVLWRLPLFIFLKILNLGIFVFCVILASIMIFAQLLFILNVMFLPIVVIISLIPNFQNVRNKAILELFNSLMLRVSTTLLVTVTFSISSLIYSMTQSRGLIITLIIQIICFLGVLLTLNKQLNRFNFDPSGASNQRIMNPMKRIMRKHLISRHIGRNIANRLPNTNAESQNMSMNSPKTSTLNQVGNKLGEVVNAPRNIGTAVLNKGTQIKGLPISVSYGINKGIDDFKDGIKSGSQSEKNKRVEERNATKDIIAKRKAKLSAKRTQVTKYPNMEMLKKGKINCQPLMAKASCRTPKQVISNHKKDREGIQINRKSNMKLPRRVSVKRQPLMAQATYRTPKQVISNHKKNREGIQINRKSNMKLPRRVSVNRQPLMAKASYRTPKQIISNHKKDREGIQINRKSNMKLPRRVSVKRQPLMTKASRKSNMKLPRRVSVKRQSLMAKEAYPTPKQALSKNHNKQGRNRIKPNLNTKLTRRSMNNRLIARKISHQNSKQNEVMNPEKHKKSQIKKNLNMGSAGRVSANRQTFSDNSSITREKPSTANSYEKRNSHQVKQNLEVRRPKKGIVKHSKQLSKLNHLNPVKKRELHQMKRKTNKRKPRKINRTRQLKNQMKKRLN